MNIALLLRAIPITFLRFATIVVLLLFVINFEVSPLPEITLIIFAYFMHIVITYFSAKWVFARQTPDMRDATIVALVFVLLGTILEGELYVLLSRAKWSDVIRSYNWQSLILIALYVVAIFGAAYRIRQKNLRAAMPKGME